MESPYSRPVEGGGTTTDSGVSISGDTISSPDSENTQQAAKPVSRVSLILIERLHICMLSDQVGISGWSLIIGINESVLLIFFYRMN